METTRPTSHSDPVYEINGVIHYAVTNVPGAVPETSTQALANATLPYVRLLADHGQKAFCQERALGRRRQCIQRRDHRSGRCRGVCTFVYPADGPFMIRRGAAGFFQAIRKQIGVCAMERQSRV